MKKKVSIPDTKKSHKRYISFLSMFSGASFIGITFTTVFVFAVLLISLTTNGYVYGIIASVIGTIAVNYAFTFPFFEVNFLIFENLVSGIVMITISILTSALTTTVRRHEIIKAESEKERIKK